MRLILLLLFTSFIFSTNTLAVSNFHIGLTGGINTSFTFMHTLRGPGYEGLAFGANGSLKALYNIRKWQFGAGIETGTLNGDVYRTLKDPYTGYSTHHRFVSKDEKVAAPYFAPHLLVNYKAKLPGSIYMYFGAMGGRISTKNTMTWNGKGSGWMAGANIGVVIKINKLISLDIYEGWRQGWIRNEPATYGAFDPTRKYYNYYYYYPLNKFNLSFFNTNIGVRFKL